MAAASVDLPAVMVTSSPMLSGRLPGVDVGSGTAVWRFEEDLVDQADDPEHARSPKAAWPGPTGAA